MSPVDRASPLTRINSALDSYEKFQPGLRHEKRPKILRRIGVVARDSRNNANMKHKDMTFVPIIALATLIAVPRMQLNRIFMMWKILQAK